MQDPTRKSTRKVDVRLPGKGNSNSHGARPIHLIIAMIKWIRTSRLSIKNSLSIGRTLGATAVEVTDTVWVGLGGRGGGFQGEPPLLRHSKPVAQASSVSLA